MQYRYVGRLDERVSALGFGCMRLPTRGSRENIDEEEATRMLSYAVDHGVNYLDSAYGYHGGNSERFVGRFLQKGYRDRVHVATKMPCSRVEERADLDRILNEQMEKLQVEHIDFYLLHGLRRERWEQMQALDVAEWLEKAQRDGRIGHLGFSFHDSYEALKQIIDAYDGWDFCQIQYNYMNENYQAGTKGLQYAALQGMGVIVMEPLLGGWLVDPPDEVQTIWDGAETQRSPAAWGLNWVWNHPEVSLALSGMSTMEQVQENVALADRAAPQSLEPQDLALIARVRERYEALRPVPCTGCRYCMPCPNEVDIPRNLDILNRGVAYNWMEEARRRYQRMDEETRASACVACGECEEECPQHIAISEWMSYVHEVLGEGREFVAEETPA